MKSHRHQAILLWFTGLVAWLIALPATASRSYYAGPGRLSDLIRDSDFVVVASCVSTQAIRPLVYDAQFSVRKQIKGHLDSFTLVLSERVSQGFGLMTGSHPLLYFLKTGPDGKPELTTSVSFVSIEGGDAALPSIISRELEINAMPDGATRDAALEHFIIPILATGSGAYTQQSLAEDLLDLCRDHHVRLSRPELALVSSRATNSESYNVALPLTLLLDQQNAPQAGQACRHLLLDTDPLEQGGWSRLAPVLASRADLLESYVEKIEQTHDTTRLGFMLMLLYQVDPGTLDSIYERLWRTNPATRTEIQNVLAHAVSPTHDQLLRRLTAEAPPPR
jgi:hypothetical protein